MAERFFASLRMTTRRRGELRMTRRPEMTSSCPYGVILRAKGEESLMVWPDALGEILRFAQDDNCLWAGWLVKG